MRDMRSGAVLPPDSSRDMVPTSEQGPRSPIPPTAAYFKIFVWFQYGGFGSSSVQQAAEDIRLIDVTEATAARAAAYAAQGTANTASTNASSALVTLATMRSNGYLDAAEKPAVIKEWNAIAGENAGIVGRANAFGLNYSNSSDYIAYTDGYNNLAAYLVSLSPSWADTSTDTPITPAVDVAKWTAFYNGRQALLNKIAEVAGTLASWSGVSGSGKPIDYAGIVMDLDNGTAPGQRQVDDPPSSSIYAKPGKYLQFKQSSSIGLPSGADYWATLETTKQYNLDAGGGRTTQYAFSGTGTWRRTATSDTSSATWTAWVIDLDRNSYTGDLNAQNNARLSLSADGILLNDGAPLSGAVTLGGLGAKALAFLDRITADAATTLIDAASINLAHIKVASIGTLGALSALLGTVEVAIGGYLRSGSDVNFTSGAGFWLGWVDGEPGIKIGSTAAYLRYRPSTGLELKLDSMPVGISGGGISHTTVSTGTFNIGSRTATVSGGSGTYTFAWSLVNMSDNNGNITILLNGSSNPSTATVGFQSHLYGSGADAVAIARCVVTDSNGRSSSAQITVSSTNLS